MNQKAAPKKLPNTHTWFAPDGEQVRVCLPSGDVAVIEPGEQRELPPKFNKAAAQAGLAVVGGVSPSSVTKPEVPAENDVTTRVDHIEKAIRDALNAPEGNDEFEDAFTKAGTPNIKWLSKRVGFTVETSERDIAWKSVQADLEDEQDENGGADGDGTEDDDANVE